MDAKTCLKKMQLVGVLNVATVTKTVLRRYAA